MNARRFSLFLASVALVMAGWWSGTPGATTETPTPTATGSASPRIAAAPPQPTVAQRWFTATATSSPPPRPEPTLTPSATATRRPPPTVARPVPGQATIALGEDLPPQPPSLRGKGGTAPPPQVGEGLGEGSALPHYTLTATLQPPTISGEMRLRYPNTTGTTLETLVLRLFPNGRPIYAGRIQVSAVTVGGQPATPVLEASETALRLPLPAPLAPDEAVTVTLRFTTTVAGPGAGYGILNQAGGVITLGSWFPLLALHEHGWQVPAVPEVGDAVSSEMALFTLELTAPAELQVASTGKAVSRQEDGAAVHWRFTSGPARDFALAASQFWSPVTAEVEGIEVRYFAAPGTATAPVSPEQALQLTVAALRTYSQFFGPYLYHQLDVVEADVPIGGYEYPGLVLFDSRHRVSGDLNLVRYLLAHELAHQWFYALVGNNVTAEPWLDESLAVFATLLDVEASQGKAAAEARRAQWEEEYAAVLGRHPVGVNRPVYAFRTWRQYRGPVYYAGALMLDDLRRELGDERFFTALHTYIKRFAFRRATAADFRATFEGAAGRDLGPFFQRWFVAGD